MIPRIAALFALMWLPASAYAQDSTRTVHVTVAGDSRTATEVELVIRELVAEPSVELDWSIVDEIRPSDVLRARDPSPGVVARVWLDLGDPSRAMLYIANQAQDRFLVRSVPTGGRYDEIARESIGHIVDSTIDAMLAGGEIGVSREVAAQQLGADAAPPPTSPSIAIAEPSARPSDTAQHVVHIPSSVAIAYRTELLGDGPTLRHGPALGLSLTGFLGGALDLWIWIELIYHAPLEWSGARAGVRFDGGGARVLAGAVARLHELFTLRGGAGIGIDLARAEPFTAPESGLGPEPAFFVAAPIASVLASGALLLIPRLELVLTLGVEADLAGYRYELDDGVMRSIALATWPVRAIGSLGLALAL